MSSTPGSRFKDTDNSGSSNAAATPSTAANAASTSTSTSSAILSIPDQRSEQQSMFIRQSTILRKNLGEWDRMLHDPRGEDWPTMIGRLNAAMNQTASMDRNIEDVMEHFVYLPRQATANAQDIPFFLSTRLEQTTTTKAAGADEAEEEDPTVVLARYENQAAQLAAEYEESMERF